MVGLAALLIVLGPGASAKPTDTQTDEQKVIYGMDDRVDLYEETDPRLRHRARATCALVSAGNLRLQPDGTYLLSTNPYRFAGFPPCDDEPFANQPVGSFCSGFAVGYDLVGTAGHCFTTSSLSSVRFVFGFAMEDAQTATLRYTADQVYAGVELVGREYTASGADWSVIRLDKPISLPDFDPLRIRREGVIPNGTGIGVMGHPSGLPLKLAFGNATAVRDNSPLSHFVANLDTYGGSSGSPVFNAATGLLEGVLVRGAADFTVSGGCFSSVVLANNEGRGEDVVKSTLFANLIPEPTTREGMVSFLSEAVGCAGGGRLALRDLSLTDQSSALVTVTTDEGDQETFELFAMAPDSGEFEGNFPARVGVAEPGNGVVEVNLSTRITVLYEDEDDGSGLGRLASATAGVDCFSPAISQVSGTALSSRSARVTFQTDETATTRVLYGQDCGATEIPVTGPKGTSHTIFLDGLEAETTYFFRVEATDLAGNTGMRDNAGLCYSFTTGPRIDHFTELFDETGPDLAGLEIIFLPTPDGLRYTTCVRPAVGPLDSPGERQILAIGDDGAQSIALPESLRFPFFGVSQSGVSVASNGFVTLGVADDSWEPSIEAHFSKPRIAPLFRDLNPPARGTISYVLNAQYITIDFDDVVDFDPAGDYDSQPGNDFQVRLYNNGVIRIVYGTISPGPAVIGLSPGAGVPPGFEMSDLSGAGDCLALNSDTDGDGMPDSWEFQYGLDPFDGLGDNGPDADLEGDGLSNLEEFEWGTNPRLADSDEDGMSDSLEIRVGLNPASAEGDDGATGDPDGDGLANAFELSIGTHPNRWDSDRDGLSDLEELQGGTSPKGQGEFHHADLDRDGRIGLAELLRVIQLHRSTGYGCDPASEDGYTPDGENQDCLVHHADYAPKDFRVDTGELLRMIQLYHADGYSRDMYSEDSFTPVR